MMNYKPYHCHCKQAYLEGLNEKMAAVPHIKTLSVVSLPLLLLPPSQL